MIFSAWLCGEFAYALYAWLTHTRLFRRMADLELRIFDAYLVNLTRIEGIEVDTALTMIAEVEPALSRFKTVKHFASSLGLCLGAQFSGGKVISGAGKRTANLLAQALRMSAVPADGSHSARAAPIIRQLSARLGKAKAHVPQGQEYYQQHIGENA